MIVVVGICVVAGGLVGSLCWCVSECFEFGF